MKKKVNVYFVWILSVILMLNAFGIHVWASDIFVDFVSEPVTIEMGEECFGDETIEIDEVPVDGVPEEEEIFENEENKIEEELFAGAEEESIIVNEELFTAGEEILFDDVEEIEEEIFDDSGNINESENVFYPYNLLNTTVSANSISASGVSMKNPLVFTMGYDMRYTAEADYNLKGKYSSVQFQVGFFEGDQRDAAFTVLADGKPLIDHEIIVAKNVAKTYTLNLIGVHRLTFEFYSQDYNFTKYAIGNLDFSTVPSMNPEAPKRSNMLYNCEPYYLRAASVIEGLFEMGGFTYIDGINMKNGYDLQTNYTSTVCFNLDKHYRSLYFEIGRYGLADYNTRDTQLTIIADDVILHDAELVMWNNIPVAYKLDVNGVTQLEISTYSYGYNTMQYRLGNIQLESDGVVRGVRFKQESVNLTPNTPTAKVEVIVVPPDAINKNYTLKTNSTITALVDEEGTVTGRHKGTAIITATTEDGGFTAECTVHSTLPAAKYVPSVHGWGFTNMAVDIEYVGEDGKWHIDDYYEKLYQRVSPGYAFYELDDLSSSLAEIPSGPNFLYYTMCGMLSDGLCHGYSVTSALTYTGDLPFSMWDKFEEENVSNPGEVKTINKTNGYSSKLDMYLLQAIFACQISQAQVTRAAQHFVTKFSEEKLIEAVRNFQNTGKEPIILKFNQETVDTNGNKKTSIHSVLPYEVLETEDEIHVFIYDSNLQADTNQDPNDEKIIFQKNADGEIISWSYKQYSNANTSISYEDSLNKIANRLKNSNILDKVNKIIITTSDVFRISKNDVTILEYKNGKITGDTSQSSVIPFSIAGASGLMDPSQYTILYQLTDEEITFINHDTSSSVQTVFAGEKSAVYVEHNGPAQIVSSKTAEGDTVKVTPANKGKVSVRYNHNGNDATQVTGQTDGTVTAQIPSTSNKVSLDGYKTLQVTSVADGKETTGKTITVLPGEKYNISETGTIAGKLPPSKILVSKVSITGISKKIAAGKTIQLKAKVAPSNASSKAVTWKSSNKKYATVTSAGKVTTKAAGKGKYVTIKAIAKDRSKVYASYKIYITKGAVTKVALTGNKTLRVGKTTKLVAKITATAGANKKLKWTSSNSKYAAVSANGTVKALRAGKGKTVTITAKAVDGSGKKAIFKIKIK